MTARTDAWVMETNRALAALEPAVPLRVDSLTTVWTVLFKQPGRYHWMYQYYLRAEGLALSWVGTGRCLFSLDFTPEQYAQTQRALVAAAEKMRDDGWWWDGSAEGEEPLTSKAISSMVAKELVGGMVASWTKGLRRMRAPTRASERKGPALLLKRARARARSAHARRRRARAGPRALSHAPCNERDIDANPPPPLTLAPHLPL